MKRKITILILMWMIHINVTFPAMAATNTVLKLVYSTGWTGTATKVMPTLINNGIASKWYGVGFTPASIAAIVGCTIAGHLLTKGIDYAQGKWSEWLGLKNYRIQNGAYQKYTPGQGWSAVTGSLLETAAAGTVSYYQGQGYGITGVEWHGTATDAQNAYVAWHNSLNNFDSSLGAAVVSSNGHLKWWGWIKDGNVKFFFTANTGYENELVNDQGSWAAESSGNVATSYTNDLTSQNPSSQAKAIADAVLAEIAAALQNGGGAILNQAVRDALNQAVQTDLSQAAKTALDTAGQVNPDTDITTEKKAADEATGDVPWIDKLIQKLKEALGLDVQQADVTNTSINPNENTDTIDADDITGRTDTAKQVTQTQLDTWFQGVSGLRTAIQTAVNNSINVAGGVCSIPFQVWGSAASLNFCDLDLSALRSVIIAVGMITAAVILIL